ncbi:hypothetical protein Fmac_021963 [Flemingia macrophylla]|uniref:Uncharacterized protein n=1 Tax=Flemingia macrophylla TaxID=520843 RepID=A0ABD1LYG7_9FABA
MIRDIGWFISKIDGFDKKELYFLYYYSPYILLGGGYDSLQEAQATQFVLSVNGSST